MCSTLRNNIELTQSRTQIMKVTDMMTKATVDYCPHAERGEDFIYYYGVSQEMSERMCLRQHNY